MIGPASELLLRVRVMVSLCVRVHTPGASTRGTKSKGALAISARLLSQEHTDSRPGHMLMALRVPS